MVHEQMEVSDIDDIVDYGCLQIVFGLYMFIPYSNAHMTRILSPIIKALKALPEQRLVARRFLSAVHST